jgi:hypothetical protein
VRNGVEPEGKNGRASPGFFSLSACTDAESLEHQRAVLQDRKAGFPFGASIGGRLLVAGK